MKPISEWTGKVRQGHVLDLLHEMPDDSVDMILTSPPYYGLRSYGEETKVDWPDGWHGQLGLEENVDLYVEHLMMVFRELKRVLKPSGSFYLNIGDTYATSLGKHGGETAGMSKDTMVGDEARPPKPPAPRLGKLLIPSRVALRMMADGWMCPDEIIWRKPNHMPSSVKNRLANSWEPIFRFVKNDKALLWRVFRDHGEYKSGTWLRARPSTPYREWMLREDWNGFKAGDWVPKKPPTEWRLTEDWNGHKAGEWVSADAAPDHLLGEPRKKYTRSRTNWLGFAYYYELDSIREPHKTTTHARFPGGGMEGPRKSSKLPVGQETVEASRNFGYGSKLFDYHTNPAGKVPDDVDEYSGKYAGDPESVNSPRARTARPGYDTETKFYAEGGKNPGDVLMREDHQYLTHPENRFGDSSQGKNPGDSLEETKGMNVPGQEPQHGLRIPGHQGDRSHEAGKNPGDVAEEVKEKMGDAHKGWATTNLYMPHVTHHELGANPGDVLQTKASGPKYEEARRESEEGRLQLPTGSWPGNAQGWWKTDAPRTTHPLGRAPEDVTGDHRDKDDERAKLDHLSLPPEPELDPQRAFSEGGKNPGDVLDLDSNIREGDRVELTQGQIVRYRGELYEVWRARNSDETDKYISIEARFSPASNFSQRPVLKRLAGKTPDDTVTAPESKYAGTELEASHLGTGRNPNIGLMKELGMVRSEKSGALGIDLSGKNPGDIIDAEITGRLSEFFTQDGFCRGCGASIAKHTQGTWEGKQESLVLTGDHGEHIFEWNGKPLKVCNPKGVNPGDSVEGHPDPETDPEAYAKWYFEDRQKQGFHQHEADAEMGFGQQKRGQKVPTLPHPYGTAPEDTLDAGPEVRPKEKLGGPSRWQKGELHPTLDPTGRFHHEGGKNPGDFWELTTQPFKGAHFAVFPLSICWNPILSSSPGKVCTKCGKILGTVSRTTYVPTRPSAGDDPRSRNEDRLAEARGHGGWQGNNTLAVTQVLGPADCGCNDEVEGGVVLDPFAGSGTVAEAVEILNILGKKPDPDELRELRAELAKGQKPLAKAAARRWIMLELSPAYCVIAENRLRPYR